MMEMFKRNKAYRGIPTALNVEFYTKARGAILATCCISANVGVNIFSLFVI